MARYQQIHQAAKILMFLLKRRNTIVDVIITTMKKIMNAAVIMTKMKNILIFF